MLLTGEILVKHAGLVAAREIRRWYSMRWCFPQAVQGNTLEYVGVHDDVISHMIHKH